MTRRSPLRDNELLTMLADDPGLLAVADALAVRRAVPAAKPRRHLHRLSLLAATAAALVALAATPALGLVRDIIPFWGAAKAPQPVVVEFASMNTGAPAGMSPQAVANETRDIGQFSFAGRSHTLWIAPAKDGGFCLEWTDGWGGCKTDTTATLVWNGDLILPADVPQPSTKGWTPAQIAAEAGKLHNQAVPRWISGYVTAGQAHAVEITFSDGTTITPPITWVSAPINAGFFAYDIPPQEQTTDDHLINVQALDSKGHLVAEQPLNASR